MDTQLIRKFAPTIQSLIPAELNGAPGLFSRMMLARDGDLSICYAPFEFVNDRASVVIVGITPGRTQMINAINEAKRQLDGGADELTALKAAKQTGAFSGSMRPNLVALLDAIGIPRWLGIGSCELLMGTGSASEMVQTTSILRNPVFLNGQNYNGTPSIIRTPFLRAHMLEYFGQDARALPNAVFIPLGDKVSEALHFVAEKGLIDKGRILDGLPHPSGANAERIAYFLGRKAAASLSKKTDPHKLDRAREQLQRQVASLR